MKSQRFTTYKGVQIWTFESLCERGIIPMFFGSTLGTSDIRLFVVAESYVSHEDCLNKVKAAFDEAQKGILDKNQKKSKKSIDTLRKRDILISAKEMSLSQPNHHLLYP